MVSVAVALQDVAYVLQGSAAVLGEQPCPGTQAATQAPPLQTCPDPQAVPSARLDSVSMQLGVPL